MAKKAQAQEPPPEPENDEPVEQAADETPPPQEPQAGRKFADRFETPEQQEKGYRELLKLATAKIGTPPIPDGQKLYGPGGAFKDITEVEAHYRTLEKAIGKVTDNRPPKGEASKPPSNEPLAITKPAEPPQPEIKFDESPQAILDLVKRAGLDPNAIETKWNKQGRLDDSDYEAIQKAAKEHVKKDVGKDEINLRTRTLVAEAALGRERASKARTEALMAVGGEQQWKEIHDWAAENLEDSDLSYFNPRLASTEPGVAARAVKELAFMRRDKMGMGGSAPLAGASSFRPLGPSTPTTYQEVQALLKKAETDDAAKRIINAIPPAQFARLMNSR